MVAMVNDLAMSNRQPLSTLLCLLPKLSNRRSRFSKNWSTLVLKRLKIEHYSVWL